MGQTYTITLQPHGGQFPCRDDQLILEAALDAGYDLPHSCRSGSCTSCQLKIVSGKGLHKKQGPGNEPIPKGICRTCQARPASDIALYAPDIAKIEW